MIMAKMGPYMKNEEVRIEKVTFSREEEAQERTRRSKGEDEWSQGLQLRIKNS